MPVLRALPDSGVTLWRPLLAMPRALLLARARALHLEWVDDESNAATAQDRNYLRHEIAPLLDARWPAWRDAVARFARNAAEADQLLKGSEPFFAKKGSDPFERSNSLRQFLASQGLAMPSAARLAEMVRQLHGARQDARVRIEHDGATLVRHRGQIQVHRMPPSSGEWRIAWHGERSVDLGEGRGEVQFRRAKGEGIDAALAREGEWCFMPRAGGEKMRVALKGRTRTL